MTCTAFYPGSFDPVTFGHLDIISRAARLFDRLVIGVGVHHGKSPIFSGEERVAMLEEVIEPVAGKYGVTISVVTFDNLAVEAARHEGAEAIVRGLRNSGDFDYEMQMAGMNGAMAQDLETVFLAATPHVRHIAAKFVRQIAAFGGDVTAFVPDIVADSLKSKFEK